MRTAGGCCRSHHHASRLHYQDELGLTIHLARSYSLPLSPFHFICLFPITLSSLSLLFVLSPQAFSLSRFVVRLLPQLTYTLSSWFKKFSHIRLTSSSASSHLSCHSFISPQVLSHSLSAQLIGSRVRRRGAKSTAGSVIRVITPARCVCLPDGFLYHRGIIAYAVDVAAASTHPEYESSPRHYVSQVYILNDLRAPPQSTRRGSYGICRLFLDLLTRARNTTTPCREETLPGARLLQDAAPSIRPSPLILLGTFRLPSGSDLTTPLMSRPILLFLRFTTWFSRF